MRRAVLRPSSVLLALLVAALPAAAQQRLPLDEEYGRLIREYTTDTLFLSTTVSTLPDHPTVPSPRDHFGVISGAPGVMHSTDELYAYYRALAAATPRVRVETIGTSEEGREILLVIVTDEQTMQRLDHYRSQLARLADPRTLAATEVDAVIADAKPIYMLNGGLHSPEMGPPEMLPELAYRLAVSDDPDVARIRNEVITIINPVAEPDGRDRQVDWYNRYTRGRETFDDGFPRSTPYWGKYVVHDNNRDGIQVSQELTRALFRAYYDWHPLVIHDLHESVPLLYISTGTGPYNHENDPIVVGEWQLFANNDITRLSAQNMPGVWHWGFFDGWWPGYAAWVANNHNSIARFYETFGNAGAETYVRDLSNQRYAGDPVTSRQWYRHWPPTAKVRWSLRNNTNYMQAGVLASLLFTAENGDLLLRNFWQKGSNSITRGQTKAPHGFVIPGFDEQRDPRRTAYLVNQLQRQAIEVHQRRDGDFVVRLDQPYRDLAVTLLTKQDFPEDAEHPPYDDIAWTLGYLYGVDVEPVDDPGIFEWDDLALLTDTVAYAGGVRGNGSIHVAAHTGQGELLPALYWLAENGQGATAEVARSAFTVGRDSFPAGSLVISGASRDVAQQLAQRFGVDLVATNRAPNVPRHAADVPRVAVYHTWYNTQDEGWARFTLEQYGVPYTSIDKDDLRAGNLRSRFDVILVPQVRGELEQLVHGIDRKWGPMPFTRTAEFPSHGTPDSTADMTGGMGFEGLAGLQRFIEGGGMLVTLGNPTRLASDGGLARQLSERPTGNLFHPGSVVTAKARRPEHPVMYGYPETFHLFRGNGPLFAVDRRDRDLVVAQYGTRPAADERPEPAGEMMGMPETRAAADERPESTGPARAERSGDDSRYVLSGMVRNENVIVGQGAIFDVPVGQGRVVAFSFNPLHRFLNHHEIPLVWNSLMSWNDMPVSTPASAVTTEAQQRQ
ncbi:MAG TPA: M14 family zinc carboxypeptidase [Longimicrobiales bacterium]|nr:M14 family zinc carboxypeptidase [Longimicrobiales bacterium]